MGNSYIKTIQPENLKTIFAISFDNFGLEPLRFDVCKPLFGNGILVVDGAAWRHSRDLMRPAFSGEQAANLDSLQRHVTTLLEEISSDGSTIDLAPLLKRTILSTSTEFIFGETLRSSLPVLESHAGQQITSESNADQFLNSFRIAMRGIGIRTMLGRFYWLYNKKEWYKACEAVHTFCATHVDRVLHEKRRLKQDMEDGSDAYRPLKKQTLLEEMAKYTDDPAELRYQIINVFIPAHDSVAILISNVFFLMARHPDVWQTIRQEVSDRIKDQPITYELLKSMKYIEWVQKETFRLYPVTTINQRIALVDTILPVGGGPDFRSPILVKKGEIVETNKAVMERDPDLWGSDAGEFRPERWRTARPTWEFVPFSGGPRICPALQQVYVQGAYVIVRFAQEFVRIENRDEVFEWCEEMQLAFQSRNGVKVALFRDESR
ncbi:MAG: hypothetical protein M1821_007673 [Bathelium mastoideum]|nr:MAG: hypothetical protein M1821_007673 [Bathelium mastoideum]